LRSLIVLSCDTMLSAVRLVCHSWCTCSTETGGAVSRSAGRGVRRCDRICTVWGGGSSSSSKSVMSHADRGSETAPPKVHQVARQLCICQQQQQKCQEASHNKTAVSAAAASPSKHPQQRTPNTRPSPHSSPSPCQSSPGSSAPWPC
jgi:hypothetical protein